MQRNAKGFTLIELMIVVAIIGILAAIVYPNYVEYVLRSWRGTAQGCLLNVAQTMERQYTANSPMSYVNTTNDATYVNDLITRQGCLSDNGLNTRYLIQMQPNTLTANTFTLRAVPQGGQSGDRCGTLSIDQSGIKGVSGGTETSADACW
jgi:type IV pilus assembly protein PilE